MDRQRFNDLITEHRYQAVHLVDREMILSAKVNIEEKVIEGVKRGLVDELIRSDKLKLQQSNHSTLDGAVEYKAEIYVFSHDELKVLFDMARRL